MTALQTGAVDGSTDPWESGDTANPYWYLPAITEGDDEYNRDGRQIRATTLELKFRIRQLSSAYNFPITCRCILFQDKYAGANIAIPTIADLLDDTSIDGKVMANINWENRKRFTIIRDKLYTITPNYVDTGSISQWRAPVGHSYIMKKWHIKLNKQINYIGTDGASISAGRGALYFIILNDATNSTAAGLTQSQAGWRIKFQG